MVFAENRNREKETLFDKRDGKILLAKPFRRNTERRFSIFPALSLGFFLYRTTNNFSEKRFQIREQGRRILFLFFLIVPGGSCFLRGTSYKFNSLLFLPYLDKIASPLHVIFFFLNLNVNKNYLLKLLYERNMVYYNGRIWYTN